MYRTILADPPWSFRDKGTRLHPGHASSQRKAAVYSTMATARIVALGAMVERLSLPNSFLYLWAPNAIVLDGTATEVARAWGFEPKQLIPWVKTAANGSPRIGGGHYTRVCTEQLLLCTKGKACPLVRSKSIAGVLLAKRLKGHSAKPDESYTLIEAVSPGPYLELFARRRYSSQWDVLGNEIGGRVNL